MQRTEPEFEQAQAFEVGVAYPTPKNSAPPDLHYPLANSVSFLELGTRNQLAVLIKQDLIHRTVQV
jgi:hypothetical protein